MTDLVDDAPSPPTARVLNFSPASVVTVPDEIAWHLVSDQELIQLSQPDGGIAGVVGFAALGGAIGALPQARVAFSAVKAGTALTAEASTSSVIFIVGSAVAFICLIIFAVSKYRNAGLTSVIRARPKMKGESANV